MPPLGGLGACPLGKFEKLHLLRLNLGAFLVNLSTFDVPVDTGTENFLKCSYYICMPISMLGNVAEITII